MSQLFDSYAAVDLIEEHRHTIEELAPDYIPTERLPSLGIFNLLSDTCTLALFTDESEDQMFHHVVGDTDNQVPVRHVTALSFALDAISHIVHADITLQFMQGPGEDGLFIPEPPQERSSSVVNISSVSAEKITDKVTLAADSEIDSNASLRNLIGAILALQSLIEESDDRAFALTVRDVDDLAMFSFFKRAIIMNEIILRAVAELNEVSISTHYFRA